MEEIAPAELSPGSRVPFPMRTWIACVCAVLLALSPPLAQAATYPLDGIERVMDAGDRMPCEVGTPELVSYTGEHLRYQKPVRVHPAFQHQLAIFEQMVKQLAEEHYGRAPRKIVHLGSYNCRRMRRYPTWVSEHALGNAIDVAGFDFGPLPRGVEAPATMPRSMRRTFSVRMERHWTGRGDAAFHATFLRALATQIISRPDVFRVVLGPAFPGHKNHLHLDHAPYRVVEVFEGGGEPQ